VYNETKLYLKTELSYSAVIDNDTEQFINIHIDITIHAPCMALSLDQQDEVGVHRLDVQDTLRKIRQDRAGRSIRDVGICAHK
jgi:Endoplasmic reticulum vesicle transporter/Endoplasmic Reticulum-Golgi Intermediate Compartment (ERGIC)